MRLILRQTYYYPTNLKKQVVDKMSQIQHLYYLNNIIIFVEYNTQQIGMNIIKKI